MQKVQYIPRYAFFLLFSFLCLHTTSAQNAQNQMDDRALVERAVEDYVLGLYNVQPERIARSVDTTLYKIGFYEYDGKVYNNVKMTYQQLYNLAGTWNKDGKEADSETVKKIDIYEVHDKTASAKLTAKWGIDFMHLSKVNGRWKIRSIIWQSDPK